MILRIHSIFFSLNSINQFIFVNVMYCVFSEFGIESLNIIEMIFRLRRVKTTL
jgi:hypothetical protein